jgi:hypothetical protein
MKKIIAVLLVGTLAACSGGGGDKPPRNLDNACAMKRAKPAWFKDLTKAERKWGVPTAVFLATIHQESKFVAKARTPFVYKMGVIPWGRMSSAYGYSQAIDSTWDWYKRETGNRRARRDEFDDAIDFMGWYMTETERRNKISKGDAYNQYLAYHQGHTGFARGSYRSKTWLVNVAKKVQTRAIMYDQQLSTCRR